MKILKTFESFYWKADGKELYNTLFKNLSKYWVVDNTPADKVGGGIRPSHTTININQHKFIDISYSDDYITLSKNKDDLKIKFTYFDKDESTRSYIEEYFSLLKNKMQKENLISNYFNDNKTWNNQVYKKEENIEFDIKNIDKVINIIDNLTIEEYELNISTKKYNL